MMLQLLLICCCVLNSFVFANEIKNSEVLNDEYIDYLNSIEGSWTAGHNFPSGTPISQLKVLLGGDLERDHGAEIMHHDIPSNVHIPRSFDARKRWKKCKSPRNVRNQGHCGSCWAMSTASAISDRLCISKKQKFNLDISAQQLTSCSRSSGCHGGSAYRAWSYFVNEGVVTGGNYKSNSGCQPYLVKPCIGRKPTKEIDSNFAKPEECPTSDYVSTPSCNKESCYNKHYKNPYRKDLHKGKNVYMISNVTQIQYEIMKNGPVVACFEVYNDFMTYKSGVYEHKVSETCGGHCVRVLGWGEERGKPYWLISNQWGREWGIEGFVKYVRGKNEGYIETGMVAGLI